MFYLQRTSQTFIIWLSPTIALAENTTFLASLRPLLSTKPIRPNPSFIQLIGVILRQSGQICDLDA
jgi:hypothetical protein